MDDCRVEQNLFYGGEERCRLDLYLPSTPASCVLVWFHGGGLFEGDKIWGEGIGRWFAQHGIACAMPNYRFSGMTQYPGYIQDAARAVGWIYSHAAEYGLDRQKFFIGGISAGAYLAAMLVMDERYLQAENVPVSSLSGGIILSAQVATHFKVREEKGLPAAGVVSDEAAPMYYARKDTVPLVLIVGDNDIPNRLEENQLFLRSLKNAGNANVDFHLVPGRTHQQMDAHIPDDGDPVGAIILDFLKQGISKSN